MPFGYKLPTFNTWGRMWRRIGGGNTVDNFLGPFYFRCQWKHRDNSFSNALCVPKWLSFRELNKTPDGLGDIVQVAGNENMWWVCISIFDVGGGFPNEYRQVSVVLPADQSVGAVRGLFYPSLRTDLAPPDGAEMLSETVPSDFWADPNLFSE